MTIETTLGGIAFLVGRVLFGVLLGFMGVNHFTGLDGMSGYAEAKGVPFPRLSVVVSGSVLVLGGLAIILGVFPLLGAAAIAVFLLVVTPTIHDFWSVDDPDQRQAELNNFLKNAALFGAALLIVSIGGTAWPYALNVGL